MSRTVTGSWRKPKLPNFILNATNYASKLTKQVNGPETFQVGHQEHLPLEH